MKKVINKIKVKNPNKPNNNNSQNNIKKKTKSLNSITLIIKISNFIKMKKKINKNKMSNIK